MSKLRLFFYGPSNLSGMALACIGPLLLLAGVIDKGWWAVSAGAYGCGWVAGSLFFQNAVIEHRAEMSLEDLQSFLQKLLRDNSSKLPADAVQHLKSIHDSLEQALPRFKELFETSGSAGQQWLMFRQVILNYLPETLGNYLKLPATYARVHKVGNTGQTPSQLLIAQLDVMDIELQNATQALFESDANKMLVNSRFLESKFGKATDFL
ncbi:hypothetical protein F6X40_09910 [Paraburkholderia sp. UCT31]|uniref:hypothetical protein n=1 Tax=Paraburkholderia sp. UCT31 TaxID=2615209 RepID=UPI0016553329|nr:hypothetical protein [Paraburkholderia sp. UCT31]MBC8737122.1 hypothetical protein [Paraburkholderia sp. UCT31]